MLKKLYIILLLTFTSNVFSQDPFYYRIDRSKGLPSNTVYDMFQDSKGFMWFSGSFGLCRYDGSQFLTFEANHASSKSGTGIKQDKTGRIWYCNFDGKILYVENAKVCQLKHNSELGFFHFAIIDNYLYVVENNEIAVYDIVSLKKLFVVPFETNKINCTHANSKHFYILTDKLHIISSPTDIKEFMLPSQITNNLAGIMMQDSGDDLLLLSKYSKIATLYRDGVFKTNKIVSPSFIQNISKGQDGLWLSTTNGIIQYKKNTDVLSPIFYLTGNNVSDVLEDKSGHLWVSTLDKGIRFIPDLSTVFIYRNYSPTALQTSKSNQVIVGTDQEKLYLTDFGNKTPKNIFAGQSNHAFYMLFVDTTANRLFGTSNTFKVFDLNGQLKLEVPLAVKDIVKIQDDVYAYSATWQCGLLNFGDIKTEWDSLCSSEVTKNDSQFKPLIQNIRGKSVAYFEKLKTIYFSTNKGLFKVTKHKVSEIKLKNESMNVVKIVVVDNFLLALTADAQLYKIDQNDVLHKIEIQQTLNGQTPNSIKLLDNKLYVFTKNSVFQYNATTNRADKIISINDDFELNDIALLKSKLVISTNKGFIITSLGKQMHYSKPVFVIDSIRAGRMAYTPNDFTTVEAQNSNLHIYFSHLCFNADNQNFILYRINEGSWTKIIDNRNVIDIENLKSGNYRIEFIYGNGFLNSEVVVLHFFVNKPYWLKWWFILLTIVVLGFLVYSFDRWRTARINRKSQEIINRIELEKAADQSKLKAIKSQMNPHFFFNALNTIQSFILDNDKKLAVNYLNKFSSLTRSILEMSDRDEVSIEEEIKVLKLYLDIEKVRFDNDFEFEIICNDFDLEMIKMPSLLLQPYVENAVKHGLMHKQGLKKLQIYFIKEAEELRIVISDNGIGRKMSMELNAIKQHKYRSFATKATENRVELLNRYSGKQITLQYIDEANEAGKGFGTTVIIKMPL